MPTRFLDTNKPVRSVPSCIFCLVCYFMAAILVIAYAVSGEEGESQELMTVVEQTDELPKYYTQETSEQTLDLLRKVVDEGPEALASRSDDLDPPTATQPKGNGERASEE
jgi:hypothetical protein